MKSFVFNSITQGLEYVAPQKNYYDIVIDNEHCAVYYIRPEDTLTSAVGKIVDYDNVHLMFTNSVGLHGKALHFYNIAGCVAMVNHASVINLVQNRSTDKLPTTFSHICEAFNIQDPTIFAGLLDRFIDCQVKNSEKILIGQINLIEDGLWFTPRKKVPKAPIPIDYGFDPYRFKQFQQACQVLLAKKMQVQRISFTTVLRSDRLVKKNFNTMVKVCMDNGITFDQIAQHYTTIRSSAFEPLIEKYWNEALAVNK